MKNLFFPTIKWLAALYAIGYIIIGFPVETYVMRAFHSVMLTIFSVNVLILLFISRRNTSKTLRS